MRADSSPSEFEAKLRPLWDRAQTGDEQAYRDALSLMAGRLRPYFHRRMSLWSSEVEDLVQDTLLAIHLQRGSYDPAFPVSAWMQAIARHRLIDRWRRHGRREGLNDEMDMEDVAQVPAPEKDSHAGRDLALLMESLPEVQRMAIQLTKIDGLSVAEAASQTGQTVSAVKVQVHRGLKRLAELVRRKPT